MANRRLSSNSALGVHALLGMLQQTRGQLILCHTFDYQTVVDGLDTAHIDGVDVVVSPSCTPGEIVCSLYVTTDNALAHLQQMGKR